MAPRGAAPRSGREQRPPPGRAADRPTFRRPGPGGAAPDRRDPRARSTRRKASGSGRPPAGRLAAPPPHPRAVRAGSSWLGPDVIQTWQQLRFKARRGAPGPRARRAGGAAAPRGAAEVSPLPRSPSRPPRAAPRAPSPEPRPAGGTRWPFVFPRPGRAELRAAGIPPPPRQRVSGPPSHRCARPHLRRATTGGSGLDSLSANHRLAGEKKT